MDGICFLREFSYITQKYYTFYLLTYSCVVSHFLSILLDAPGSVPAVSGIGCCLVEDLVDLTERLRTVVGFAKQKPAVSIPELCGRSINKVVECDCSIGLLGRWLFSIAASRPGDGGASSFSFAICMRIRSSSSSYWNVSRCGSISDEGILASSSTEALPRVSILNMALKSEANTICH